MTGKPCLSLLVVVAAGVALALPARAGKGLCPGLSHERCGDRQIIARVDKKVCPATPSRPELVIKRACCLSPNGKTRCKSFPHCPSKDGGHQFTACDDGMATAESDPCLKGLPVPTPTNGAHRVVQMVNCSKETLLGAATAAFRFGNPKTPVLPREHTWVMEPVGSPDHKNVLTIDIPEAWENTKVEGSVGPILWARTGCRYDIASDRAQCETGGSSGKYDVSRALLGPSAAATIVEWTFYEQVCSTANDCANSSIKYFKDSPDISAVNGVNLNVDLEPLGGDAHNPFDALTIEPDPGWLNSNIPLTTHGEDLRAHSRCQPETFQVKRSDLTSGTYAFVVVGDDGKVKGPNTTVACLSNCARYEYPNVPTGPLVRGV